MIHMYYWEISHRVNLSKDEKKLCPLLDQFDSPRPRKVEKLKMGPFFGTPFQFDFACHVTRGVKLDY